MEHARTSRPLAAGSLGGVEHERSCPRMQEDVCASSVLLREACRVVSGAVRCGVVWCGVVWCGVVWCGVVWCRVVRCGVLCCVGMVRCGAVRCGVLQCPCRCAVQTHRFTLNAAKGGSVDA